MRCDMKAYFWMIIEGVVLNAEVKDFYLYRAAKPMDILRDLALETGACDEILMLFEPKDVNAATNKLFEKAKYLDEDGKPDPLRPRKFPEAFLTIIKEKRGAMKYRLKGVEILLYQGGIWGDVIQDPYGYIRKQKGFYCWLFAGFDNIAKVHHAASAPKLR
jgi:hypothetical protein